LSPLFYIIARHYWHLFAFHSAQFPTFTTLNPERGRQPLFIFYLCQLFPIQQANTFARPREAQLLTEIAALGAIKKIRNKFFITDVFT
jgi:hypothetical protein